ncbi:hypothetical protein EI42_05674 [Thermosporothrix hazakensis]|uniref:Uncharacterized protein n=1 Tax=Thermosporothrix hazakensis TaxID=644383 RepID=A0A326U5Y7_THEHA|nr:hypothetical protein [Thermosporothrix hazakensis]PZW21138.1 hypothetical protein EI42_05674 [Thermosporothrix hazakensis]GCE50694.1 hypothetical protein KTH_55630 [Thermosporothrix hazakensis]
MHVGCDIDGTIARRNMSFFASYCNQKFALGLSQDQLERISYRELLRVPQMQEYKRSWGEQRFRREIGWLDLHPDVLVQMLPFPYAREGINQLARLSSFAYYTVRYSVTRPQRNEGMAKATRHWLQEMGFPEAPVVFCRSIAEKLVHMAHYISSTGETVFLIDDRYDRLLEEAEKLEASQQEILRRSCMLVAFGAEVVPERNPILRLFPLPSWHAVSDFLLYVQEC